jgi:hypothetical protein
MMDLFYAIIIYLKPAFRYRQHAYRLLKNNGIKGIVLTYPAKLHKGSFFVKY